MQGTPVPLGEESTGPAGTPILFVQGDADSTPPAVPHAAYDAADPPEVVLTVWVATTRECTATAQRRRTWPRRCSPSVDWQVKGRNGALDTLEVTPSVEIAR